MVNVWKEKVIIPTYKTGGYEKYPMFFEKRVYQGSSGAVYPYPIIEKILDEKADQTYEGVFIENEYLKIMILPELGGRVQMAWDKIKERHFVYYNRVIKPALVGLTGPWISGGIEFNWPQHHRPSTFLPVDCQTVENTDGSCTIWVSETEKFNNQECRTGFTLHPGKAYLEVKVRLFNGTPFPQTFLWWANPAVAVNDHHQTVFPPDVKAVYDHGKRDVSSFPVATGKYYKIDYSNGVDISRYKNIPVPTSYMAVNSKYDFLGGYEHDNKVGMIHLANHRISPGKKMWTWGNSNFGKVWNQHLTDEDGPYVELMAGVFTDNQPDFSWLQPYEERTFSQYFIPYSGLGMIKNVSKDLLINVEEDEQKIIVSLQSTTEISGIHIVVDTLLHEQCDLKPGEVYRREIDSFGIRFFSLIILDPTGKLLLEYVNEDFQDGQIPSAAQPAKEPQMIKNCEEAYLTGLHLEQYRHAHLDPVVYYRRALELDPFDIRSTKALGMWSLRKGKFNEALNLFNQAIASQKRFNPNPNNGEAFYNLGLALSKQRKLKEAYDAFYKATWNAGIQDAAWFECAKISSVEGRLEDALSEVNKSLRRNGGNYKALGLKTVLLRKTGKNDEALALAAVTLLNDPFHVFCHYEMSIINRDTNPLFKLLKNNGLSIGILEVAAFDYASFGFYSEAVQLLDICIESGYDNALIIYSKAWFENKNGQVDPATSASALLSNHDYCFPNRLETIGILEYALEENPRDYKAHYLLGNFWYDKKQYESATIHWQKAVELLPRFAEALRNLAIVTYNQKKNPVKALEYMEEAFRNDPASSRLLLEMVQLGRLMGQSASERLGFMMQHKALIEERDDLYLELICLNNLTDNFDEATRLLELRKFHPWEGGEGKVLEQYRISRISKALIHLSIGEAIESVRLLKECLNPPESIGEGKLPLPQDQDVYYYLGVAYKMLEKHSQALSCWQRATEGDLSIGEAFFYNDTQADRIYYQAKAWMQLGEIQKAVMLLNQLIAYGEINYSKPASLDYFTVSFPNMSNWNIDLDKSNKVHCLYLQGLGFLGTGNSLRASDLFRAAIAEDTNHQGARMHYELICKYQNVNLL